MIFDNHLRYALLIVDAYKGDVPLHVWLKEYFRQNKQMGSKDRKTVSNLVYQYYRVGYSLHDIDRKNRMIAAIFLCNIRPQPMLDYFRPSWNAMISLPSEEKARLAGLDFSIADLFPSTTPLSDGIDPIAFNRSFLIQPDLFLRVRPRKMDFTEVAFHQADISYCKMSADAVVLTNGTKIGTVLTPDRDAVVQDYSSQKTIEFMDLPKMDKGVRPKVWDCCAASGGKSIMFYDKHPDIELTVSDIRPSILSNLKERFQQAGIKDYHSFVADLSIGPAKPAAVYDLIIADLPCTGSGTWSRTPEAISYFDQSSPGNYSSLQKKILQNLIPSLREGGKLVYLTCSVFREENEAVADFALQNLPLTLERMHTIAGYQHRADSMFAATFTRK